MYVFLRALGVCIIVVTTTAARATDAPFTHRELKARTFELAKNYFKQFQHPETHVLYGARLSTKENWTTPEEVKSGKPKPWGYGSRIADTALHCGHTLVALLDAYDAAPDPFLRRKAEELYFALKFIGGICPVEGLVPRGPHPNDPLAYYDDSSMDQHTTYIIALARYANSDLATTKDKQWIAQKLDAIGQRLENNHFSIKAADGMTESHVGFSWKGFRNNHVSILIPTLYALYKGTSNVHWLKLHDAFLAEREGLRWQMLHAGDHVELNGHPIYANQNGFRLNAYLHFLADPEKREVISELLAQSADMQLRRDFPGPFYRKFHSDDEWAELAGKYHWDGPGLPGAEAAWNLFQPKMLDDKGGLAPLAHVRFPLGGYHLVLMSGDANLIRRDLPTIWKMLTTVDLGEISAAETHYLFTTVALHAYAYYHRHPNLFAADQQNRSPNAHISSVAKTMVNRYCIECHNSSEPESGLDLEGISMKSVADEVAAWEHVVKKMRARQMPPEGTDRPNDATMDEVIRSLEIAIDQIAMDHPQPGRTETFRRLTRFEYQNAIRDLLSLEIDVTAMLPADEVSHGFDNITVGELSPTLVNRYISAAQKISRLAIGRPLSRPEGKTIRVRADVTQEEHVEGLPIGTRGGVLISHTFPQAGEYEVRVRLARDRNEHVEGLSEPHELEILLDSRRAKLFTVHPPRGKTKASDEYGMPTHENVDRHLQARIQVSAGPHQIGVTFLKNPSSLLETKRQPLNVHYNMYRHPRISPAVYQVSINGPFQTRGNGEKVRRSGDTPSRRRILICQPEGPEDEENCAKQIIGTLMRRACRQPIDAADLANPMALYHQAREQGEFETGIELALSAILIHPEFLFRIERDPVDSDPQSVYHISDVELASRLSFFLWSSIPDDELLDLAEQGELSKPDVLEQQTRRMLADDRSAALVSNFASQWLYLRNLESITPDGRLFPDFDDNLRQAFRQETELFFESILREDRSVLDLLKSNYTYLNERLAKHYGIPHIYGSRFRRVSLDADNHRGGLLRQGSILTVTSYATRTSPVLRGKWILENVLGTPTPPPPPNVPALTENTVSANLSVRERLAQHRADPVCASCHDLIDPAGFALENYDAVGRWRDLEGGQPVDASGGLPDGSRFTGVAALEQGLLDRPEMFVGTMVEKLLTYAIGRGHEHFDAPAVRKIVRDSSSDGFRFSSLILGIVKSTPFQMRTSK